MTAGDLAASGKADNVDLTALARRVASSPPGEASTEEDLLCRRLGRRVWLYGLRHLRDEDAANDLAQQVMMTTLESLRSGRVREPERVVSFTLGTARNLLRDERRGARRRRQILERFGTREAWVPPAAPPLDLGRLDGCMEQLPQRERAVVALTFYAERESHEIGAELALSKANVRVVRHRALARLRDCMEAGAAPAAGGGA